MDTKETTLQRLKRHLDENGKEYYKKVAQETEDIIEKDRIRKAMIQQTITENHEALKRLDD